MTVERTGLSNRFVCPAPKCGYSCAKQSNLQGHVKRCTQLNRPEPDDEDDIGDGRKEEGVHCHELPPPYLGFKNEDIRGSSIIF